MQFLIGLLLLTRDVHIPELVVHMLDDKGDGVHAFDDLLVVADDDVIVFGIEEDLFDVALEGVYVEGHLVVDVVVGIAPLRGGPLPLGIIVLAAVSMRAEFIGASGDHGLGRAIGAASPLWPHVDGVSCLGREMAAGLEEVVEAVYDHGEAADVVLYDVFEEIACDEVLVREVIDVKVVGEGASADDGAHPRGHVLRVKALEKDVAIADHLSCIALVGCLLRLGSWVGSGRCVGSGLLVGLELDPVLLLIIIKRISHFFYTHT
jgi:hypothetical protein